MRESTGLKLVAMEAKDSNNARQVSLYLHLPKKYPSVYTKAVVHGTS